MQEGVASFRGLINTTISHNVFYGSAFRIAGKSGNPSGLTIQSNIFRSWGLVDTTACTSCTISTNMFNSGAFGSSNVIGTPTWVGGTNPDSYAGFELAEGSAGEAAGVGGEDMGPRYGG
jgi:hypothetical protein